MSTSPNSWTRRGAITASCDESSCNPVEAACRLRDGIYYWQVRVGSRGTAENQVADWAHLSPAVERAIDNLVNGEPNIPDPSKGPATPAPLDFDVNWSSDWVPADSD